MASKTQNADDQDEDVGSGGGDRETEEVPMDGVGNSDDLENGSPPESNGLVTNDYEENAENVMGEKDNNENDIEQEGGQPTKPNGILPASDIAVELPEQVVETSNIAKFDVVNDENNPIDFEAPQTLIGNGGGDAVGSEVSGADFVGIEDAVGPTMTSEGEFVFL